MDPATRCWELGPTVTGRRHRMRVQTVRDHQVSLMERHRASREAGRAGRATGPNDLQELRCRRRLHRTRRAARSFAAGAVLWRTADEESAAPRDRGGAPAAVRRLVAAEGQGRSRRDRTCHRGAGRSRRRPGSPANSGRRLTAVELSRGRRAPRGCATGRPVGSAESSRPTREVDELVWLPVERRHEAAALPARPEGAASLRQTACRYPDRADRPARAPRAASPLQG